MLWLVVQVWKLRQVTIAVDHVRTECRTRASCRTASARYAAAADRARMGISRTSLRFGALRQSCRFP
jgi:hypothetical protein